MDTNALKKFAQEARRVLLEQVEARLEKVLHTDSVELREKLGVVNELRAQLEKKSKENLIEEVAYTWFNRFCALRYMDFNHITKVGVVSPMPNFTQPEILQEAKQGVFDKEWQLDRSRVRGLLDGSIPSSNPEQEAYRLLLVAVCNSYADEMDFLFPRIEDYTELLMPEDLLSTQSVLHSVREALTEEVCQDVEVIGWLYQFYISEKKDEVMGQKGKVVKEDIPAVTQLFTPHWIVRYMVENSLGRLWLLNHPGSKIRNQMEYYIEPEQQENTSPLLRGEGEGEGSFLKVDSPEELKILDPACGSGHILTYAFDLLYAIYEEMGYDPISIPQLILENNLYGIEIDKRAAMLSSFALMMKAVEKDKRFFTRDVQPNILEMEDVSFEPKEVKAYMAKVGEDLWTQELWEGLQQFEDAKTFGSLIRPTLKDVPKLRERLKAKGVFEDLFLAKTNEKVQKVLDMSEYLRPRYQVVVANPPYLGSRNMNKDMKDFANNQYPDSKKDCFAMFIERNVELARENGLIGLMTPYVWMYLSSYEKIRNKLINDSTIISLVKPSYTSFFSSAIVPIVSFIILKKILDLHGIYFDLGYLGSSQSQPIKFKDAINHETDMKYKCFAKDFKRIPGNTIAYWVGKKVIEAFEKGKPLKEYAYLQPGLQTSNNSRFLRFWHEVDFNNFGNEIKTQDQAKNSAIKWFSYNKGGDFRKWYGNFDYVVNWFNNGKDIKDYVNKKYPYLKGNVDYVIKDRGYYFKQAITWSFVSSSYFGVRYSPPGSLFDVAGSSAFPDDKDIFWIMGFMCSKISIIFMKAMNPTMNFQVGDVASLPIIEIDNKNLVSTIAQELIDLANIDWDRYEISWDFSENPILEGLTFPITQSLFDRYKAVRKKWRELTQKMIQLECENNSIFIEAYGLINELDPKTPLKEITLTCNPKYRYGGNYSEDVLEARLLEDTIKEFISYAVGCMFGRYSIDKPGLILANQGETIEDYYNIPGLPPRPRAEWDPTTSAKSKDSSEAYPGEGWGEGSVTFPPTETNVIPILEGDWFADDILVQFKRFLRVTFGEENFAENLRFIEKALGKDLQKYFLRDFYKDHVQMYKKCPIYWLFSSPNGSFNALIYMHRYTPETVSVILNQYLREYRDKLTAHRTNLERISINASARDKSQAFKEIEDITKILAELKEYEDEVLYPLASKQIQIDLDDGVKVNYAKFDKALKKI